jgi:hypothetical protein
MMMVPVYASLPVWVRPPVHAMEARQADPTPAMMMTVRVKPLLVCL